MMDEEMRVQPIQKLENLANLQSDKITIKQNFGATNDNLVSQTTTHNARTVKSNFRSGEQYTLQYLKGVG